MLVPLAEVRESETSIICEVEDYECTLGQSESDIPERHSSGKIIVVSKNLKHEGERRLVIWGGMGGRGEGVIIIIGMLVKSSENLKKSQQSTKTGAFGEVHKGWEEPAWKMKEEKQQ